MTRATLLRSGGDGVGDGDDDYDDDDEPFGRGRLTVAGRPPPPPTAARKVNAHTAARRHRRPTADPLPCQSAFDGLRARYLFVCSRVARRRRRRSRRRKWNFRRAHYTSRPSGTAKRVENNASRWMVSIHYLFFFTTGHGAQLRCLRENRGDSGST